MRIATPNPSVTGASAGDTSPFRGGKVNKLTAEATGLEVFAGPTEGTAIGNLIVQFIAAGELADLAAARACVSRSFDVTRV